MLGWLKATTRKVAKIKNPPRLRPSRKMASGGAEHIHKYTWMKFAAEHAFRQHRNSDTLTAAPTKQESSRTERDSTDADNMLRTWRESCDCSVDSKPEAIVHASEKHRYKSCSKQARKGRPSWASNKQFSLKCKIKLGAHTKNRTKQISTSEQS